MIGLNGNDHQLFVHLLRTTFHCIQYIVYTSLHPSMNIVGEACGDANRRSVRNYWFESEKPSIFYNVLFTNNYGKIARNQNF